MRAVELLAANDTASGTTTNTTQFSHCSFFFRSFGIFTANRRLIGVIGDEERLSGGGAGQVSLVFAESGSAVGFGPFHELLLGLFHVGVGSFPRVQHRSLIILFIVSKYWKTVSMQKSDN